MRAFDNNETIGGNPAWNGNGEYSPFISNDTVSGGGGGGGYVPPVEPNPTFIPPSERDNNFKTLKINLSSQDVVEFTEDDKSVGFGTNQTITYSPGLTFGNSRTYKANVQGKKSINYFVVAIQKKYKAITIDTPVIDINPYSSLFGYQSFNVTPAYKPTFANDYKPELTINDKLYSENILITEYTINDETTKFTEGVQRTMDSTSGVVNLEFKFVPVKIKKDDIDEVPANPMINYEIGFASNLQSELGDILKLEYQIISEDGSNLDTDSLLLKYQNTNSKSLLKSKLDFASVNFKITGELSNEYSYKQIYYTNVAIADKNPAGDFSKWNIASKSFSITGKELSSGIVVAAILEKEIQIARPEISVSQTKIDIQIKDSDTEKMVTIPFSTKNSDNVIAYLSSDKYINVKSDIGYVNLFFQKDFNEVYGTKKIILTPTSELYGTGDRVEVLITFTAVNDFPSITQITFPNQIDVPSFSDLNIAYQVEYNSFATSTIDVDLLAKDGTRISLIKNASANGVIDINLRTLAQKFSNWNGNNNVTLIFKPYNRSGVEELIGNEYEVVTNILYPSIQLDETIIKKSIYDAFLNKLSFIEPEKDSKYLTHLANFGNDEQIIISSFEEDNWTLSDKTEDALGNLSVSKEVKSVILKLYSPLPANVISNSTFWITKLMSNPLIETVVLNDSEDIKCPPIKGPNFNVDVDFVSGQSTAYESLDNLFYSTEATSSANLVSTYLSSSIINTDNLNIEYYISGSDDFEWKNFVHFSSAAERVDNFIYKLKLIEKYETTISASNYDPYSTNHINSIAAQQERERQQIKKEQIIQGFDGFEKFLYTSSSVYTTNNSNSITWPYVNDNTRVSSTSTIISNNASTGWYDTIISLAVDYDKNNPNYIQNNIPQFIVNNEDNASLLLFFAMIGHHFDNIYYHTKAIEKSRGLGYKSKNGMSDKMLFDTLKSFGWDAKNLAADKQLWEYAFGLDIDGNKKNAKAAKDRTTDVWRRIVNNLPYLLKHKGTRRGIYAIMACYGVPSSNLSILEFGGPEVTETTKSKLVMDNITTALVMENNSFLSMSWQDTDKGRKPDTIELFVKPAYSGNYTIISGSQWNVTMSGSVDSSYGKVKLNISSSNVSTGIESSLLPIFNERFFGIEVSRETGSNGAVTMSLNLRQADKERSIFQYTSSLNLAASNWESGSKIQIGGNYIGSLDEFRLWSTPLDKERFFEHVSFPEMINGNHISASTDDLYFRLDFEYPKNLAVYDTLPNVDTNVYFSGSLTRNDYEDGSTEPLYSVNTIPLLSASAYFPTSITTYPYQFEAVDRTVVLEIPDMGASRYSTNKVRFESQYTLDGQEISGSNIGVDLSVKNRATKKSFDQSPTDSNRVGLFFSPTKELNFDIAKSLGGINLDDYIGDPSDRYKSNYRRLDDLRKYYFERFDGRDIYAYINLIKLYEKSMFDDIKKMLPARVKATTGLLIEPHFLERSKVQHKKPTGENNQYTSSIHFEDTTNLIAENSQYDAIVDGNLSENLIGENYQYDATIYTASVSEVNAENYQYDSLITNDNLILISDYYQKEVSINAELGDSTILAEADVYDIAKVIGQTDYETIGFGIYAQNGHAIRTYFDKDNRIVKERIRIDLITEEKERVVRKFAVTASTTGAGDPRGGYVTDLQTYTETKLNIQPYSGSKVINVGTGSIVDVQPVSGYLKTHYRNTSDLTTGMRNSYYLGSKNTAATTLDGTPPVETFTTNPNTLKVNKAGRDASEPILEVE